MISIKTLHASDLTAAEAIALLQSASAPAFIDVRSPSEFTRAHVPGFVSAPILNDEERHRVGIIYKEEGRERAIDAGLSFTAIARETRLSEWVRLAGIGTGPPVITCWRGGLRSRFAADWLKGAGVDALRVSGGYQALRNELLSQLERLPPLFVLAGYTGCGKTEALSRIRHAIDLEGLARHRGSSFGGLPESQPFQAVFENSLFLKLRVPGPVVVEAESARIGGIYLPAAFKEAMSRAPAVVIESPLSDRVRRIYQEYVEVPWRTRGKDVLRNELLTSTRVLSRRLGDQLTKQIGSAIEFACSSSEPRLEQHADWIECLLTRHYDTSYEHSFGRQDRKIVFRGSADACVDFLNAATGVR